MRSRATRDEWGPIEAARSSTAGEVWNNADILLAVRTAAVDPDETFHAIPA